MTDEKLIIPDKNPKVCPLILVPLGTGAVLGNCEKDHCGWYDTNHQMCMVKSLPAIADCLIDADIMLDRIVSALEGPRKQVYVEQDN